MTTTKSMLLGTTAEGVGVELDVPALIGSHLCIQANAGGGKSRTIRKILELAEGLAQRIVLDVEDEFHTLREASPRMIVAGPDGDCPANLANAAALPLFLLETGVDAVVQINQLGLEGRRQFIALFLTALIGAPRKLWHPALVVLDETHRYAPQAGKEASSDAVAALASEGRKRGYTAVFATQRMAKIDKDATGDVNNWLMGRAGQAVDRERCADELGLRKTGAEIRGMGRLAPGNFWAIGPALSPDPVLLHVGDVKTTHLRSGERGVPVPPGAHEIRAMMAKLHVEPTPAATAAGAAKVGTTDPAAAPRPADKAELAAEYQRGFGEGRALGDSEGFARCEALVLVNLENGRRAIGAMQDNATAALEWITDAAKDMRNNAGAASTKSAVLTSAKPVSSTAAPVVERETHRLSRPTGNGAGSSPAGGTTNVDQRVLDALAELESMGVEAPQREIVGFMVGYSNTTSKPFARAIATLGRSGEIIAAGVGQISLTPAGRALAAAPPKRTGEQLRARIVELLGGATADVLGALVKAYPGSLGREELAASVGYTNTTSKPFARAMSRLSSLGFVHYPATGQVRAADLLFAGA